MSSKTLPLIPRQALEGEVNTHLQIVATYPMCGDNPGAMWAQAQFNWAKDQGLIDGFEVIGCWRGYTVENILFSVDVPFGPGENQCPSTISPVQAREWAENHLNGPVIQDSDVEVVLVAGIVKPPKALTK